MTISYDKHYKTENLFGHPYPELIKFFDQLTRRGRVLDLGCGQGRDAIALARIGFTVTGIDHSTVGVDQMNRIAVEENLSLTGLVGNIYEFNDLEPFDFILLDSMFHFTKSDRAREVGLVQNIISKARSGCLIVFCIQDTGNKVKILIEAINSIERQKTLVDQKFCYVYKNGRHTSETNYRMIVVEKSNV
ncbi:class I SAM-dependent methyltransferase [Fulvivirga sedimenti]|uniref:Methyltransferase domain-containing protein n=1 Tax=Fulvivirga sedimenti TaxID=2879465 RepID=A0A9X1L255_9BACT|nr:methyltransferase domain-containing protein [Fulvivirga sedimenti]MCA6078947.1 methyltransferase domain-containing protein [Fulvivirga sedimenti]